MMRRSCWKRFSRCEGAALMEFAVSCLVLIPMLFGFIEVCLAFYAYNFVSDAAREATRYAMVRGSKSCSNFAVPNCGITAAQIQTYVRGLQYPGLNAANLTATTKTYRASATTPTTWTSCGATPCMNPGNQVQVQVQYNFPIGIPFWKVTTISIGSVSAMVISQ